MSQIREAAATKRTLNIDYIDSMGKHSSRTVEPYEIKNDIFYAHCMDADGIRGFKVNNILAARATNESFEPRFPIKIM